MSHFTVLVIGDNAEKQLEPFCEQTENPEYLEFIDRTEEVTKGWKEIVEKNVYENIDEYAKNYHGYFKNEKGQYGYNTNPNAKWDWYQLGGRWTGFFKMKPSKTGIQGEPGLMTDFASNGYTDSALKKDIDFEGREQEKIKQAEKEYSIMENLFNGKIPRIKYTWKEIIDGTLFLKMSIDEKRDFFWGQIPELETIRKREDLTTEERTLIAWFQPEDWNYTKEEYIEIAKKSTHVTFAVLLDGKWYEKGEMGWWGCVSNEKEKDVWTKEFYNLLKKIPEDSRLSVYDCHI